MAKTSAIQRAIDKIEAEINMLEDMVTRLRSERDERPTKPRKPAKAKIEAPK